MNAVTILSENRRRTSDNTTDYADRQQKVRSAMALMAALGNNIDRVVAQYVKNAKGLKHISRFRNTAKGRRSRYMAIMNARAALGLVRNGAF